MSIFWLLKCLFCKFIGCRSCYDTPERSPARLRFTFECGNTATGDNLEISMNLEQQVSVTVAPLTAHGNPAAIDGMVVFTVSHPDLVTVSQTSDVSAMLVGVMGASVPAEGVSVLVTAEFDADLGEGVTPVTSSGALLVTSPQATTAEIIFGEPTDQ